MAGVALPTFERSENRGYSLYYTEPSTSVDATSSLRPTYATLACISDPLCRTADAQLRCVEQTRSALTLKACKSLVLALVNFVKAALYGITGTVLHRPEMVQRFHYIREHNVFLDILKFLFKQAFTYLFT